MAGQSEISAGTMLDERYRIDNLLSVGGMGKVYAGTHVLLQKRVAIKVLRSELPHAHLLLDRFHREAIAASAIGHQNIVEVTDMGLLPDHTAYLVMELLEGQSLRELMRVEAPMAIERACRICCEILDGLGAAHQAGIVHRDLKPDNIFAARKGRREVIKILDFGVSLLKRPNVPDTRLTSTGIIVGTPRYMSPEQAGGEQNLTGAVDIYAAGVVLYEMLTGQLPYFGENYNVIVHEIMGGKWMPLETRRPEVPREIAGVVRRAMSLAAADRFASAEDMMAALEPFAGKPGLVATGPVSRASPTAPEPPQPGGHTGVKTAPGQMAVALAATEAVAVRARPSAMGDLTPDPAWTEPSRPGRGDTFDPVELRRRSRAVPLVVAGLVVAGGATGLFLWKRGQAADAGDQAAAPAARVDAVKAKSADAAPAATEPVPPPEQDMVTIDFVIVPSTAVIYADEKPVEGMQMKFPRGDTPIKIRIEAPDYAERTIDLVPNRDREYSLELTPRPSRPEELKTRPPRGKTPKRIEEEEDPNAPPSASADAGAGG